MLHTPWASTTHVRRDSGQEKDYAKELKNDVYRVDGATKSSPKNSITRKLPSFKGRTQRNMSAIEKHALSF